MDTSELAMRMKFFEKQNKVYLDKNKPICLRLDGKSFSTFTKGLNKPFDMILMESMWEASKILCESIQGCKVAYTQSDEITLFLNSYENEKTDPWFGYNVEKIVSNSASIATLAFNKKFFELSNILKENILKYSFGGDEAGKMDKYNIYNSKIFKATFDSRAFNLPKDEVNNNFYWRESDARRNSIQMVAQANFSHKELQNLNCNQLKESKIFKNS